MTKIPIISMLSGDEPKYEPKKWNEKEKIKYNHNCYSYVLNAIHYNRKGKPQPGYASGFKHIRDDQYDCNSFRRRLKKDNPGLYLVDFNTPCKKGFHKGFLALATGDDTDYHFWRQDKSGYWSHKPGRTEVTNIDASGKKIINPEKADRKYSHFDYKTPCFFFCVNPKFSIAHSRRI